MQWGFNPGQNVSTHLLKLTPYAREKVNMYEALLVEFKTDVWKTTKKTWTKASRKKKIEIYYAYSNTKACYLPVQFPRDVNVIHEALDVEWQVWGVGTHEFFQFFTLLVESDQGPRLGLDIKLVFLGKFLTEMLHQYLVKVLTSQLWVTSRGEDLKGDEAEASGVINNDARLLRRG